MKGWTSVKSTEYFTGLKGAGYSFAVEWHAVENCVAAEPSAAVLLDPHIKMKGNWVKNDVFEKMGEKSLKLHYCEDIQLFRDFLLPVYFYTII